MSVVHYADCPYIAKGLRTSGAVPCNCDLRRYNETRVAELVSDHGKPLPEQPFVSEEYEEVDHPAHYGGDWVYEPIKVMEAWSEKFHMAINIMMAIKYLVRAGRKPGVSLEQDLCKAIWHIKRELNRPRPLCPAEPLTRWNL